MATDSTPERCPTCSSSQRDMDRSPDARPGYWNQWKRSEASYVCPDPWHGSQDVEGGPVADKSETGRALSDETNQGAVKPPSTTQEAEKALGDPEDVPS